MTFDELKINTPLKNALYDLGYVNPTPIQKEAFPPIMAGNDIVGIAQTGTGKTFAYLLPILKQHKFSEARHPSVLIIVPTRELVIQVVDEAKKLAKYINIRVAGVYGGTNINTQKQLVYDGLDILVATPGRLLDLNLTGVLRLKTIKKLVIDEVDEMLNLGFRPQLLSVLEIIPDKRQSLMFSATLTEDVAKLITDFFNNPQKIEIATHGTPLEQINQQAYHVPNFYTKVNLLEYLLSNGKELSKVLVFVDNKKLADRLFEQISPKFPDQFGVMHSNKSQNYRINTLRRFQEGTHRVLIATDILARGLDITNITHVVNFDTPSVPEVYIHRIGRTGRKDKAGISITFINEAEQIYQNEIETLMNKNINIIPLPQEVDISTIFTDEEIPKIANKEYIKTISIKDSQGAFHEKSDKNKKTNLGGSYRRKLKAKYKKPLKRSSKK